MGTLNQKVCQIQTEKKVVITISNQCSFNYTILRMNCNDTAGHLRYQSLDKARHATTPRYVTLIHRQIQLIYVLRVTKSVSNGQPLQVDLDSWVVHVLCVDLVPNGRNILASIRLSE